MDPTKTVSYRRWRKKLAEKGYSGDPLQENPSFFAENPAAGRVGSDADGGDMENQKPTMFAFNRHVDDAQAEKLIKNLEREYRKTAYFRKEKVAELKRRIASGQYAVPGREVVDKWFKDIPESKSNK